VVRDRLPASGTKKRQRLVYLALAGIHARLFALLLFVAAVGGLGNGLFGPALSASYLDITREQNRSVIVGIKGSASSLGGVAGPFLVAVLSPVLGARGVFAGAAALAALAAILALAALRFTRRATVAQDEQISERAPVVAAGLRGIAAAAAAARNDARARKTAT
jgi:MFS family permease